MTLYLIGLGLDNEKDISINGFDAIKKCKSVYLESYTSKLQIKTEDLEKFYNKPLILANRNLVESNAESTILKDAKEHDTAFLVIGDALSATTHLDIITRAKELNIPTKIIHNTSIMTAIGITGLQLYKFGKTASIPLWEKNFEPKTPYFTLKENQSINAHTLLLLDIKMDKNKFMTIKEAITTLLKIEAKQQQNIFTKDTFCIGCARLGSNNPTIFAGTAEQLLNKNFGEPLHSLIVPGKMHFTEEEAVSIFKI